MRNENTKKKYSKDMPKTNKVESDLFDITLIEIDL